MFFCINLVEACTRYSGSIRNTQFCWLHFFPGLSRTSVTYFLHTLVLLCTFLHISKLEKLKPSSFALSRFLNGAYKNHRTRHVEFRVSNLGLLVISYHSMIYQFPFLPLSGYSKILSFSLRLILPGESK